MPKRPHQLRIIGGQWRGRRLPVPEAEGLRPTPDRVRETLFNWLREAVPGARCLDLFAGSGALGLEAASRGAREVILVERERRVAAQLRRNVETLGAATVRIEERDALLYLEGAAPPFDIVFLDPPFHSGLLGEAVRRLERGGRLAPGAHIYLESEREAGEPALPTAWRLTRSRLAGEVGYHLAIRDA